MKQIIFLHLKDLIVDQSLTYSEQVAVDRLLKFCISENVSRIWSIQVSESSSALLMAGCWWKLEFSAYRTIQKLYFKLKEQKK